MREGGKVRGRGEVDRIVEVEGGEGKREEKGDLREGLEDEGEEGKV